MLIKTCECYRGPEGAVEAVRVLVKVVRVLADCLTRKEKTVKVLVEAVRGLVVAVGVRLIIEP